MNLRELRLQESCTAEILQNGVPFRWLTHHISQIYTYFLPKVDINGSGLITLEFGPKSELDVEFDNMLGCTNVFIENFNFRNFYDLSLQERNFALIEEIRASLITIHKRKRNNTEVIQAITSTADKVIESGFNLDIPIKKLEKISKDKSIKIEIHRILNAEVGESWRYSIINRKDRLIIKEDWLSAVPNSLDRRDFYKKSEMKENIFRIYDNPGNITFELEI